MIIVCSLLSLAYAYAVVMGQDLKNYLGPKKKPCFFNRKFMVSSVWLPPKILETLLGKNPPLVWKYKNFEMGN